MTCALGDFSLSSGSLEAASRTDLGAGAAGVAELPSGEAGGGGGAGPGLNVSAWAAIVASRIGPQSRRRQEDELSSSMASCSTASTLKRGGNGQVDEAALHLAMAMVSAMSRRHTQPLEVFAARGGGAIVPPKAPVDEPTLLLGFSPQRLRMAKCLELRTGHQHEASRVDDTAPVARASPSSALPALRRLCVAVCHPDTGASPVAAEDIHGVLRCHQELHRLCASAAAAERHAALPRRIGLAAGLGTGAVEQRDSPFSPCASDGSLSDLDECDSRTSSPVRPTSRGSTSSATRYLAVIFDSQHERDRCLAALREAKIAPAESQAGSPAALSPQRRVQRGV